MCNIEIFLIEIQVIVIGSVIVKLYFYCFEFIGIQLGYDLMNSGFGQYGEMNKAWSGEDVKGFIKILLINLKIYYFVQ